MLVPHVLAAVNCQHLASSLAASAYMPRANIHHQVSADIGLLS
jgi:hypothetical protein